MESHFANEGVAAKLKLWSFKLEVTAGTVFCDQIRMENNGKFFIIGAYTAEIASAVRPANMYLSTFTQIYGLPAGIHNVKAIVSYSTDSKEREIGNIETILEVNRPDLPASIYPQGLLVEVDEPGVIKIDLVINDGKRVAAGCIGVAFPTPQ
jgi:hypothetical protein